MGVLYYLHVDIDKKYSVKNVNYIFKKFHEYKCIFLAQEKDSQLAAGHYFLTPNQAANKVLTATEEMRYLCENALTIKCGDTSFSLRIDKREDNLMSLSIHDFSFPWGKNFWNGKEDFVIDFARYISLALNIIGDVSIVCMEASSDHADKWVLKVKNCITATIDMGSFQELGSDGVNGSLRGLMCNGVQNNFIFFDEKMEDEIEPSVQRCYDTLKAEFPVYLYAKVDNVPFKIEIKKNERAYDFVSVYPLEPYRMKKGYDSEKEKIDLAFYIKRLIELCENFAIYELKTFL